MKNRNTFEAIEDPDFKESNKRRYEILKEMIEKGMEINEALSYYEMCADMSNIDDYEKYKKILKDLKK